jgi:ubiquinone/menaquinone biosynthesis C-methylase UbiE
MKAHLSVRRPEDRGQLVARFIEEAVQPLEGLSVLDLGCGQGEISAALRSLGARLTSTDFSLNNIQRTRERLRSAGDSALLCTSSALDLPFPASQFDLVILNGVLEWVGKAAPEKNPEACQLQALIEVRRVLKDRGWLYLAIENRSYPYWVFHDPHVKIPLVAILPRPLANFIHRRSKGCPYINYIHTYRKLRSLIREAGFKEINFYIPIFHYRWPLKVLPAEQGRQIAQEILALRHHFRERKGSLGLFEELKFVGYSTTAFLGLSRLLFPSFVVLARHA